MSRTTIRHKNQEIEVVTRRPHKSRRPVSEGLDGGRKVRGLFASLEGRTGKPEPTTPTSADEDRS